MQGPFLDPAVYTLAANLDLTDPRTSLRVPLTRVFGLGFRVYGFEFNVYGLGRMVWKDRFCCWLFGFYRRTLGV